MGVAGAAGTAAVRPKRGLGETAAGADWTSGKRAIEASKPEDWMNSASEAIESKPTTGEPLSLEERRGLLLESESEEESEGSSLPK
jgi:hypothetical protein